MRPISGTASEYGQSQVVVWPCAWHTSSQPHAMKQSRHITQIETATQS
jgi:hypothetical protein